MNIDEEKSLQCVYVGLDISKEEIEICVINSNGRILHTFQVSNTRSGFHKLIENLQEYDDILFGMESTGPYSGNLNQFLRNINAQVVLTNPFQVARLRDVSSKSVKTDIIDSLFIAQALRMRVLKDSQKEDQYIFLQDLLERYYDLVERRIALSNQLRSNLIETFPELDACFSQIYSRAALSILSHVQTAKDLLNVEEAKIKKIIKKVNGRMANKQLASLIYACRETTGWKISDCHKIIIKSQVEELKLLNQQIEGIQETLDNYSVQFEKELALLASVPGISKQISYLFLAIIGDYQRFDRSKQFIYRRMMRTLIQFLMKFLRVRTINQCSIYLLI